MAEKTWDWQLIREADGSLFLSVVCGTVGVYELEVPFDAGKVAAYEARGPAWIQELADEVRFRPHLALETGMARLSTL